MHGLRDGCWQKMPRIKQVEADKETPSEKKAGAVFGAINGFQKLRDIDRRNLVGQYAARIYRMPDTQLFSRATYLTVRHSFTGVVPARAEALAVISGLVGERLSARAH